MNSQTINCILTRACQETPVRFLGVFSANEIPQFHTYNQQVACVVNTDPSYLPGSHWVAFFVDDQSRIEFFDSYGSPPIAYGLPVYPHIVNNIKLQSPSTDVCGHYSILYVYLRAQGAPRSKVIFYLRDLANNPLNRDMRVRNVLDVAVSRLAPCGPQHRLCLIPCSVQCCRPQCFKA